MVVVFNDVMELHYENENWSIIVNVIRIWYD